MVDNALDWLWRTRRIRRADHDNSMYGVRSHSHFPLRSNLGRMCPPEKRPDSLKVEITVKRSDQGFESGFCSPEGALYWSDEEWEFLPYIQEQRKTKFFKTADEAFGAAFKFIQEHRMW